MQRMTNAPFDRADGRHQRLSQHLAAEHALRALFRTQAAENILFDLFQIEQVEDFPDR